MTKIETQRSIDRAAHSYAVTFDLWLHNRTPDQESIKVGRLDTLLQHHPTLSATAADEILNAPRCDICDQPMLHDEHIRVTSTTCRFCRGYEPRQHRKHR